MTNNKMGEMSIIINRIRKNISARDLLLFFIFALLVFLPKQIRAEESSVKKPAKKTLQLSLKEGIEMLLAKNLDITIERIVPEIEETRIEKEQGIFDPEFLTTTRYKDSTTPLTTRSSVAAGGLSSSESEIISLDLKIAGKVPFGTGYEFRLNNTRTKDTFNQFEAEYDSFAGIKITQPLLKDSGWDTNLFQIRIARKDKDIAVHDLKLQLMGKVAELQVAYWDLVMAIEELKVSEESLRLAGSLLDRNRKRLKAGVISPLEVTQAEAGVASRQEDVIIGKREVEEKENVLKRLISPDLYAMRSVDIIPTDKPSLITVEIDFDKGIEKAMKNRPEYSKAVVEVEKKGVEIKYARNQVFPRLDFEASYGYNGIGESFGESIDDLNGNPEWLVGLTIRYPLWNRGAREDLSIARLEARRALLNLKNIEQDIIVEIDNAVRDVETNIDRIEVTKVSTRLAEEALEAEERKLNAGMSTSHNVLEFQERLAQARSNEIRAIIDYNKSLVELLKAEGTILEANDIIFSEWSSSPLP